jgi:hypothetical protein
MKTPNKIAMVGAALAVAGAIAVVARHSRNVRKRMTRKARNVRRRSGHRNRVPVAA